MFEIMMNLVVEVSVFLHVSLNVAGDEDDAKRIYSYMKPVLRQDSRYPPYMVIFAQSQYEYLVMIDNCLASAAG